MTGIYKITNIITNTVYIGSSINVDKRMKQHKRNLQLGTHINHHLQSAWNKYGESNFTFDMVEYVSDKSKLLLIEEQHISMTKSNQYNQSSVPSAPMTGKTLTVEQKLKIGNVHRGKIVSPETRKRISDSKKNTTLSTEHKWNIFYNTWKTTSKLSLDQIQQIFENEDRSSLTVERLANEYNVSFRKMWSIINDLSEHPLQEHIKNVYKNRKQSYLSLAKQFGVTSDRIKNVIDNRHNYQLLLQKELKNGK